MKCQLLGEGPLDLGSKSKYPDAGIRKGPMTIAIDAIAAAKGVPDIEYELLTRVEVSIGLKRLGRSISSRPKAVDNEREAIFRFAYYLGKLAAANGEDLSVYFHDADHTNSGSGHTAGLIARAMLSGFEFAGFHNGVPMVPNPRSESWLLAYFQKGLSGQHEYNKAERFENLPGNDSSPNSAKKLLQKALGNLLNPLNPLNPLNLLNLLNLLTPLDLFALILVQYAAMSTAFGKTSVKKPNHLEKSYGLSPAENGILSAA